MNQEPTSNSSKKGRRARHFLPSRPRWIGPLGFVLLAGLLMVWSPTPDHELPDDTPWRLLMNVTYGEAAVPSFPDSVRALEGRPIQLTGFMVPLGGQRGQRHFLLSAYPLTCNYCVTGGPSSLVEVVADEPVRFSYDPVIVHGTFELVADPGTDVMYRIRAARVLDTS